MYLVTCVKVINTVWNRGQFNKFQNGPPQKLVGDSCSIGTNIHKILYIYGRLLIIIRTYYLMSLNAYTVETLICGIDL